MDQKENYLDCLHHQRTQKRKKITARAQKGRLAHSIFSTRKARPTETHSHRDQRFKMPIVRELTLLFTIPNDMDATTSIDTNSWLSIETRSLRFIQPTDTVASQERQ